MEKSKQQPSVAEVLQANCSWIKFLISIVSIWIGVALVFMGFKYWALELPLSECRISLANFLSLGAAIGAIAVAVFAWMAYRYATHQYLRNEVEKLKFKKKFAVLAEIIEHLSEFNFYCLELKELYSELITDLKMPNIDLFVPRVVMHIEEIDLVYREFEKKYHSLNPKFWLHYNTELAKLKLIGVNASDLKNLQFAIDKCKNVVKIMFAPRNEMYVYPIYDIIHNQDNQNTLIGKLERQLFIFEYKESLTKSYSNTVSTFESVLNKTLSPNPAYKA